MDLSQFNFPFDQTLVAKYPVHPRDHARLLVLTRSTGDIIDRQVKDLPNILRPGDLLVVNNTKVIPARLWAKKVPSGGRVELLFVKEIGEDHAEVLIQGKVGVGQIVECEGSARAQVVEKEPGRTVIHWLGPGAIADMVTVPWRNPPSSVLETPTGFTRSRGLSNRLCQSGRGYCRSNRRIAFYATIDHATGREGDRDGHGYPACWTWNFSTGQDNGHHTPHHASGMVRGVRGDR